MSYTLAGIRQRVLVDKLDDEDFETSVVDNFINDTQRDIFSEYELPFTEKIFTGTLPTGTNIFQFPDDVSSLQAVIVSDDATWHKDIKDKFMSFREFNKYYPSPASNQVGYPSYWTLYGGSMITDRRTDKEYLMTIYYNKVPTTLTAPEDVPELPEEFEELLVLGAFYRVQLREGDSDEALLTKSEYQRKLEQMVNRYGFRMSAGPIRMNNRQVGRQRCQLHDSAK